MLALAIDFVRRFARNRAALVGFALVVVVIGIALAAPWMFPRNPLRIVGRPEIWPFTTMRYPLGTDSLGRDIAAMIAHGARTTLLIGLCASLTATLIGISVGAIAAYFGGWVDEFLMRMTELFQTIPNLIFVLTIVSILGQKIEYVTIAVGIVTWTPIARLTRAEFMSLRDREFVQACRSMGMGNLRIMFGEILPNALPPVIVLSSLVIAGAVLFESAVSFLGLGDPNVSSWGRLIGDGRTLIRSSWYICAVPGVAIMLTVLALNLVGDGLNDALNPKLRDR
ncbi:peptide/nickel transport system permease protein [Bradyrhizobium lablabi]|uniref:Peptide/nickel transport system permease protein n=1 Tax=Bradyrhizobium lablabi TaxID=722472 RepID=A0A1M6K6Z4_9BRAD|nr:ABC transporter permease [Bradyrhizobium lablabi]SHJ54705.1 peptide/nickel transport system permease protein [Bradyrhizobium lablabi]